MTSKDANSKPHTDRRIARTKQAIHAALGRLAEQQDYRTITVTALAREANIDRKTFYLHYSSVDDVVKEYIKNRVESFAEQLRKIPLFKDDAINVEELYSALGVMLLPDLVPSKELARHVPPELLLESIQAELVQLLIDSDEPRLKSLGPFLEYCVSFIVAGAFDVYRRWLLSNSEIPLGQISSMTAALALEGASGLVKGATEATPAKPAKPQTSSR